MTAGGRSVSSLDREDLVALVRDALGPAADDHDLDAIADEAAERWGDCDAQELPVSLIAPDHCYGLGLRAVRSRSGYLQEYRGTRSGVAFALVPRAFPNEALGLDVRGLRGMLDLGTPDLREAAPSVASTVDMLAGGRDWPDEPAR